MQEFKDKTKLSEAKKEKQISKNYELKMYMKQNVRE